MNAYQIRRLRKLALELRSGFMKRTVSDITSSLEESDIEALMRLLSRCLDEACKASEDLEESREKGGTG